MTYDFYIEDDFCPHSPILTFRLNAVTCLVANARPLIPVTSYHVMYCYSFLTLSAVPPPPFLLITITEPVANFFGETQTIESNTQVLVYLRYMLPFDS